MALALAGTQASLLAGGLDADAAQRLLMVGAFALAGLVVWRLSRPDGRWGTALRRRFLLGVPWGTLSTGALVAGVYLFVQGGLAHWNTPVVVAFRAWSYFYPLGMATAAFAHNGPGHLLGNLAGTVALAPLVEYAWGHYPRERGSQSFSSALTNPYVRAFVVFPGVVVAVGLATALFALGPIIGFSGVVFAFAGFALVRYPYTTLLAVLASRALRTVRFALQNPVFEAKAEPVFSTPWWATVAIQGHTLGLLIGTLLGFWYVRTRADDRPTPLRLWTAVVLFGFTEALWAVYWYRGGVEYVLYRGVGVVLVVALATLVTAAVLASERPVLPERVQALGWALPASASLAGAAALGVAYWRDARAWVTVEGVSVDLVSAGAATLAVLALVVAGGRRWLVATLSRAPRRQAAMVVVLLAFAAVAGAAIPVNLVTVSDQPLPGESTSVRDYQITYAENVTSGMVGAVDVEAFGETTNVRTSGVIVRSERRTIWTTAASKSRLAFDGNVTVRIGGLGWRERIVANRTGWRVAGTGPAYRITFYGQGETPAVSPTGEVVYTSPPANASPTIAGRNVSVHAEPERFVLDVTRENASLGRVAIPQVNETVAAGGLRFENRNQTIYAIHGSETNRTRIAIAARETYE